MYLQMLLVSTRLRLNILLIFWLYSGLTDSKAISTPIEANTYRTPLDGTLLDSRIRCSQMVDSLVYLTITQPDIIYVVQIINLVHECSSFYSLCYCYMNPSLFQGTLFHGLHFSAYPSLQLHVYSDADQAGDPTNHHSATVFYLLCDSLFSYHRKKQRVTA